MVFQVKYSRGFPHVLDTFLVLLKVISFIFPIMGESPSGE